MGEAITRQDLTPGDGVYKSTDAGATWTHLGLKETRHIAKVRIHPTNPDIVYVAAAGDIFGTNPEPFQGRVTGVAKTECRVVPDDVAPFPRVQDKVLSSPNLTPILVERTDP